MACTPLGGPGTSRVNFFYLMTDWSVASHVYVKHIRKTTFLLKFCPNFQYIGSYIEKSCFRSRFCKVTRISEPFLFFFLVKTLLTQLEIKARLIFFHFSFRLSENFLIEKRTFFYILKPHACKSNKNCLRWNIWNEWKSSEKRLQKCI